MRYFFIVIGIFILFISDSLCSFRVPPGTVLLDKKTYTYIDVTEITVLDWAEYLFWLKKEKGEQSEAFLSAIPDSATCEKLYGAFRYFSHPRFRNYPMVGINYSQAIAYCQWRTDRVNEKTKKEKITYVLPDVQDYQMAFEKQKKIRKINSGIEAVNPKKRKLTGIGFNAQELTADSNVIVAGIEEDHLIFDDNRGISYTLGFRCKAIIVKE
ncbi:MAG: SUMF1/EgtB/PvdO family nonheme iron enzyme [Bacteroidales bacterium]|nr:SUMF1/EgtB/PvdO family nonheme iron enzyme [Bacteroidales bacterium]